MSENEKGVYTADGLPYGKYLLYEKKAPEGYVRDLKYYSFEIENDNEYVNIENIKGKGFMNVPINPSPKTGDDFEFKLFMLIMVISAIGVFSLGSRIIKNKRR